MARTPKPIGNVKALTRRPAKCDPQHVVYIYCEGSITEPEYIRAYYNHFCKDSKIVLSAIRGGEGVPKTLVEKCVQKMTDLKRKARTDSFEKNSSVWAVFDIDEHPEIDESILAARQAGVQIAISNPCIEIYGLMHDSVYERPLTRFEAQRTLAKVMPGYDHNNSPTFVWGWCSDKAEKAIANSSAALDRRTEEGSIFPRGNPCSDFHKLLQALTPAKEKDKK